MVRWFRELNCSTILASGLVMGHGSWQVVQKFSGGAGGDGSEGQELAVGAGVGIWLISWRLA